MPNGRYTFKPSTGPEQGRHQAYTQPLDGEYVFGEDPGTKQPFDTYKDATKDLQAIIGECVQKGKRLRARGSLWSLSTAAVTNGRLINTTNLRVGLDVPPTLTVPNYAGDVRKLRFVECGNSISALNDYLFDHGLSLKASGSNNGQTIVGALSTGTHGGAYKFGAISEMVVGIHLIVGPNKHVYLERQSYPVMKPSFAQMLGAEFKPDDTLFNAALVSFGSFGIIHGLMIETRDLFALNALRFKVPYDATLKAAITACDPTRIPLPPEYARKVNTANPYHFELFVNVNEPAAPQNAFMQVMYETEFTPQNYHPPKWDGGKAGLGADGLNAMGALLNRIPGLIGRLLIVPSLNETIEEEFAPYLYTAVIRDLFRGEKTLGKTLACGVGMPANRAVEAMEIAFKRYRDNGDVLPALLSCRFVKPTKALLGFQRFEPTAVFEMDSVNMPKTRAYFEQVWADLDAAGIPFTLHWGKYNNYWTPQRLRAHYGNAVDQWIASRKTLLDSPQVRECFTNPFMESMGLAG
jgi:FAD binding domain